MSAGGIRLLIADDHPVVRAGLRGMLEGQPDLLVVGEAADGAEAVSLAASLHPDVVLMDLRMPGLDGVAATAQLRARCPAVRVLVLTTYDTEADIERALRAGATSYLLKDARREELFRAIRQTALGKPHVAPEVAGHIIERMQRPAEPPTERELQVLRLVAAGLSNKEIAARLHISETTVKTHLLRTFNKLGVDDRTAAVTEAIRRGLLQLDP